MNALWRVVAMMVVVGGCDETPTKPDKLPPLNAQIAYVRRVLTIPDLEGNPLGVDELVLWIFDAGQWRFQRQIGPHPSSQVPPDRNVLYWSMGQYWLDSTEGRHALYVFERQDGAGWSFRTGRMVDQEPAVYSQVIIFGQDHISIDDDTYTLAPLDSLEVLLR